jgi:Ca2+/Na+ antiporter
MDNLMNSLTIILVMLIFFIIVLAFIYWYMSYKGKKKAEEEEKSNTSGGTTKIAKEYTKKSIFQFMQFDKIEDNMIVQDNGQRYLMVIECEGVNYDLMSQVEKTAVEAGFVQFLNTLRYPIQLYTQTRTINIGESIQNYKSKLAIEKKELDAKQQEYNRLLKSDSYNEKQADILRRELIRLKNLYEYGQDVIENIQKTSQNKNVLRKHYYIVVPYNSLEIGTELLDEEEKKSMIFSELYTRAQSLIRALFACEMKCKILNSNELVELLYIAYNRDESETYSVEKAIKAGYSELYTTAPDVLDKRMKALDERIEESATKLAKETIDEVRLEKERKIIKKEENFEELVKQMAEALLKENEKYVGKDVAKKAINKINKKGEGGEKDEQKAKKRTRRASNEK